MREFRTELVLKPKGLGRRTEGREERNWMNGWWRRQDQDGRWWQLERIGSTCDFQLLCFALLWVRADLGSVRVCASHSRLPSFSGDALLVAVGTRSLGWIWSVSPAFSARKGMISPAAISGVKYLIVSLSSGGPASLVMTPHSNSTYPSVGLPKNSSCETIRDSRQ